MTITIRPATESDSHACGDAMYVAFRTVDQRHGFPSYFTDRNHAQQAAHSLITADYVYALVAEGNGRILGSAFMNEKRPIHAIGPVSVHPDVQTRGIGRKFMNHLLDRAHSAAGVRLTQDAFNVSSLALYASLGFSLVESLVILTGKCTAPPPANITVRSVRETDRQTCIDLSHQVIGFDRVPQSLLDLQCIIRDDHLTAYTADLSVDGYSFAETEDDMRALIHAIAAQQSGPCSFLLPTRYASLLRDCLANGFRITKPLNLMVKGQYQSPQGCYLPNLLY
jgi:predicted N-acetyltransferase YhbS